MDSVVASLSRYTVIFLEELKKPGGNLVEIGKPDLPNANHDCSASDICLPFSLASYVHTFT